SPSPPFFLFNDSSPPEISTLSLHDALPISAVGGPEVNTDNFSHDVASFLANPVGTPDGGSFALGGPGSSLWICPSPGLEALYRGGAAPLQAASAPKNSPLSGLSARARKPRRSLTKARPRILFRRPALASDRERASDGPTKRRSQ